MAEFNIDFSRANLIVLVGKQASGKSFALRALMKQFAQQGIFEFGTVFTGSKFNSDYNWSPEGSVHSDYSEERLGQYIKKLESWLVKNNGPNKPKKMLPPSYIIFDDLLGKMKQNSDIFSNFIANYRHYSTIVIVTSQYLNKNVSTLFREMCDFAFIYQSRFKNTRESLYDSFGQMLENQEFNEYLEDASKQKYSCLLYQSGKDTKEESYLSFKAPSDDKQLPCSFYATGCLKSFPPTFYPQFITQKHTFGSPGWRGGDLGTCINNP